MSFVEVAVDAPMGPNRTLSYSVPAGMDAEAGNLVWAPLGSRLVKGIIFEKVSQPDSYYTKDIRSVVGPCPLLTPASLDLARWISQHYLSSLYEAAAMHLPYQFEGQVRSYLRRSSSLDAEGLGESEQTVLSRFGEAEEVEDRDLLKGLGKSYVSVLRRMLTRGNLARRWELPRPKAIHRTATHLCLPLSSREGADGQYKPHDLTGKAADLYTYMLEAGGPVPTVTANKSFGPPAVKALLERGIAGREWVRTEEHPPAATLADLGTEMVEHLTAHQEEALSSITEALDGVSSDSQHLLYGVTGSGKTEVYLRALERCVSLDRQGIFLVPEIALTPQTLHRLNQRFPGRVALLHSQLTPRQRLDQWWGIKHGKYDVVVGPRSAVFAPVPKLGLIVMDEEHEWAYKQVDAAPRYHAREVALKRAALEGAVFVAGSATPDVCTYFRASMGELTLHRLPERVSAGPSSSPGSLAEAQVCDMREELKAGNRSIFSRELADELAECLGRREQAILYLNRRGAATIIQCRDCGHTLKCRTCGSTLIYHTTTKKLLCHLCSRRSNLRRTCPACGSEHIRYLGLGTQRVVDELEGLLPGVKVVRWDRDAAPSADAHQRILADYLKGDAQVLVGTQMIAKGLHLPNVTLVGVVLADVGMNLPDFRAGERTFQLLCQVAGRAGRGDAPGRVIIQTYNPEHYAVEAAAAQDYLEMYRREVDNRRELRQPPYCDLVNMVYTHTNPDQCQKEAERLKRALLRRIDATGVTDIDVLGPAPAYRERVRGQFRWHLVLRGRELHSLIEGTGLPDGWTVDVDPVSTL
ncbi:MAG: primosomal protein N' [Dehalococcoidia bacterium]|nr:primosomal protein N' [Dehalococcoidia bacterium]